MAIRINAGTAPQLGRLTMPKGTYLNDSQPPFSQPSTAADGGLGTGGATLPAAPQLAPGSNWFQGVLSPSNPGRNVQGGGPGVNTFLARWLASGASPGRNVQGGGAMVGNTSLVQNPGRNVVGGINYPDDPIAARFIQTGSPTNALKEPTNSLVGNNLSAQPTGISPIQVKQLFPNLTDKQISEKMVQMGYAYQFVGGRGGIWVKAGEGTGTALPTSPQGQTPSGGGGATGPVDSRGRPSWVDPTQLARGERVTTQSGMTFVGGTPTESGQAQYAVTIPGGVNDERFKWASSTQQDNDGNWVKVYKREKRAQYTRQWRKKQQARAEEAAAEQPVAEPTPLPVPSVTVSPPLQFGQLVNLRADYG